MVEGNHDQPDKKSQVVAAVPKKRKEEKTFLFLWEAKDKTGSFVSGKKRSSSREKLLSELRQQGYTVRLLKIVRETRSSGSIKKKDVLNFVSQLATMVKAGVPLLQSLEMVGQAQKKKEMVQVVDGLAESVKEGNSLAQALQQYPKVFDRLFVSMIKAGEESGMLDQLIERLSTYLEKSMKLKSQIRSALIYPTSVCAVAFIVIVVMMVWVIPSFKNIFENLGSELPPITQMMLNISNFIIQNGFELVVIISLFIFFAIQLYKRSRVVQMIVQKGVLKIPVVGTIISLGNLSRWCRTLATMVKAGMPLVDAIDFSGYSVDNLLLYEDSRSLSRQVRSGVSVTIAMRTCPSFPEIMVQMLSVGEESGRFDFMVEKVAQMYGDDVDVLVKNLSALLEPFIIVFLGGIVALVIVAMYMPIFKMGQAAA